MWNAVSSRIWTRTVVSDSYDDNHYTMGASTTQIIIVFLSYTYNFQKDLFVS